MLLLQNEINHFNKFSHRELADEQKMLDREQLTEILAYIAKLINIDTKDVPAALGGGLTGV